MSTRISDVADALELAAGDATNWENACNIIGDYMGAGGVVFVPANPHFRGPWMSCSTALKKTLPEYLENEWHLHDPREAVTVKMLKDTIATDADIYPDRAARFEIPIYRDFLCRHNFGVVSGVKILTPNGYFGLFIHYANDHPGMCDEEYAKLLELQKLVEETVVKAHYTAHEKIAAFAQFFSGSESEVFVLDQHGAQTLRIDTHGKMVERNDLGSLWPAEIRSQMHEELVDLCSSNSDLSLSTSYAFKENQDFITVLVIQAPSNLRHFFMPLKVVAIRTLCSDSVAIKQRRLSEEFELTNAEITATELLSSGNTPNSIATLLGLKVSTVRQRLKTIFGKTDVNGQVELVALYNEL